MEIGYKERNRLISECLLYPSFIVRTSVYHSSIYTEKNYAAERQIRFNQTYLNIHDDYIKRIMNFGRYLVFICTDCHITYAGEVATDKKSSVSNPSKWDKNQMLPEASNETWVTRGMSYFIHQKHRFQSWRFYQCFCIFHLLLNLLPLIKDQ